LVAVWFGLIWVFAPVKGLAGKIVTKMTCNVSTGMLNPTTPYHLSLVITG